MFGSLASRLDQPVLVRFRFGLYATYVDPLLLFLGGIFVDDGRFQVEILKTAETCFRCLLMMTKISVARRLHTQYI